MVLSVGSGVLLGVGDIAALAGVKPNVVSNWRKRAPDSRIETARGWRTPFPEPDPVFSAKGRPVFHYESVVDWLESNGKETGDLPDAVVLWSAYTQSLQGIRTTDAMLTVLALASLRRLCEGPGGDRWADLVAAAHVSWDRYREAVAELCHEHLHEDLVALPAAVFRVRPIGLLDPLLDALGRVPVAELPVVVDAFLTRLDDSLGRKEASFGSMGSPVAKLLGRMAADVRPRTLFDPVAGMGGALTEALRAGANPDRIVAADIDADALRLAQRRLFLRGKSAEVVRAALPDGEGSAELADLRGRVVIAEPPFYNDFKLFEFLHLVSQHLTDSGAGFVVTRGAVLDSRSDEAERRDVLQANILSAVVALPPKLLRHSPMPLALWVLHSPNKGRAVPLAGRTWENEGHKGLRLVDASDVSPEELVDVVASRLVHQDDDPESAWVTVPDLEESGVNLNPQAWISQKPDFEVALSTLKTSAETLVRDSATLESLETVARPTAATTLGELADAGLIQFAHGRPTDRQEGDVMVEAAALTTWISDGNDAGRGRWPVWIRVLQADELLPDYLVIALRINRAKPVRDKLHHMDRVSGLLVPWMPIDEQRAFVEAHKTACSISAHAQALADAMVTVLAAPGWRPGGGTSWPVKRWPTADGRVSERVVGDSELLLTWPEISLTIFSAEDLKASIMDHLFHDFEDYEDLEAEQDRWSNLDWGRVEDQLIERTNQELPAGFELTVEGLIGPPNTSRDEAEFVLDAAADAVDEFAEVRAVLDSSGPPAV